ncbi:MAG TPA: hypothetical protein VK254_00895 [Candidatus Bathyarchaeia archaeon]|nr:hypothetical protein [Candidatus Bathyarchaeia archaeon]
MTKRRSAMTTKRILLAVVVCFSLLTNAASASAQVTYKQIGTVIVAVDSSGKQIQPDLKGGKRSGDLTFAFEGWNADEITTLQGWIADMYPLIKRVYGPPAFAIEIKIVKGSGPWYNSYTNEVGLSGLAAPDQLCHEIVHAFHDDLIFIWNSFEEGMARAVEVWVMSQLPYPYWDRNHSSTQDDVWYAAHNVPAISCSNGNFFMGSALAMARYQEAAYAWAKLLLEDLRFFLKFNAAYYAAAKADATICSDIDRIKSLIAQIKPKAEGDDFSVWYAKQKILDFSPGAGYQFLLRGGKTLYGYLRDANGGETPLAGAPVSWDILDAGGHTLGTGSGTMTDLGWIDISTQFAGYSGKIVVSVTAAGEAQSFTTVVGNFTGIFGAVPGEGTVTVFPSKGKSLTVAVSNGAFSFPTFEKTTGQFRVIYQPADGSPSSSMTITKDAANYYIPFK